ncbi:MAG: putative sporulation protein YtxC [Thermaerobacterales bacterium]
MLDTVAIGLGEDAYDPDRCRSTLEQILQSALSEFGLRARVSERQKSMQTVLDCQFDGAGRRDADQGGPTRALCRRLLARALSHLIMEQEERLVRRVIRNQYDEFDSDEQAVILNQAVQFLRDQKEPELGNRQDRVSTRLFEFLSHNDQIHLDGFVTFRLKDYIGELQDAVDRAVDDYLIDQEYRDFIYLLKYFVEVQEPRVDMVHVIIDSNGWFTLINDEGETLDQETLQELVNEIGKDQIVFGDLLVSALISIAPRQVLLHRPGSRIASETMDTIRRVFDGRVYTCRGCSTCRAGYRRG